MRCLSAGSGLITLLMLMTTACPALAQRSKKKDDPPKPRPVKLGTKDGMELSGFYFGSNEGKKAIPVLLVHGWEGQKAPYGSLCMALRNAGCAVLALDYRGHGGSREYTDRAGNTKELDPTTMNKRHVANIVRFDLEAAKAFLKKENNEGRLNLNALTVIGVRDGCVLAAGWTQRDWQFPSVGSRKQGQDVKALVMVSPERVLKGIAIDNALVDPSVAGLPTLVVVGEGSREESDARRVIKRLEVLKKKISGSKDPEGLEVLTVRQPLGGPALVTGSPKVIPEIVKFITSHVEISETDNPWIERE